jgi:hypothetical protein
MIWDGKRPCSACQAQASKVPACAKLAQEAMAGGMAVVIGLQSTGGCGRGLASLLPASAGVPCCASGHAF